MIISRGLPSTLSAGGVKMTVRTGSALWVWLSSRMAEADEQRASSLLAQGIEKLTREGREIPLFALSPDEAKAVNPQPFDVTGGALLAALYFMLSQGTR